MSISVVFAGGLPQRGELQSQFMGYARRLPPDVRAEGLFFVPADCEAAAVAEGAFEPYHRCGVPVHILPLRSRISLRSILACYRRLRDISPHIVHAQHAIPTIHCRLAGLLYRLFTRRRLVVITEHRNAPRNLSRPARLLQRLTEPAATLVLCSSTGVERAYYGSAELLDPARFVPGYRRHYTFHNSIDTSLLATPEATSTRPALRAELGLSDGDVLLICVARFVPQKAHDDLLRALALLDNPGAHLALVGEGPLEPQLRTLADELGLSARVSFLGPRRDVPALLAAADLFVLASRWEGLSKALLEALAAGLPCVATAVEGTEEVISHGTEGLLVPPDHPRELATAVASLIADPSMRARMSHAARARAARFSIDHQAGALWTLYRALTRDVRSGTSAPTPDTVERSTPCAE